MKPNDARLFYVSSAAYHVRSRTLTSLATIAALLLLFAFLASLRHLGADFARPNAIESAFGLLLMLGGVLTFRWFLRRPLPRSDLPLIASCAAIFLISRGVALWLIPSLPVSDFASYVRLADLFTAGRPLPPESADPLFFPWGFPALLAAARGLLGETAPIAPILAVTCGMLSLPLLYDVARRTLGRTVARGAAVLYVLWPAQLFMTAVVASEHPATLFTLLALSAFLRAACEGRLHWTAYIVFAASIGAAGLMRPVLGLLAPIAAVYIAVVHRHAARTVLFFALGVGGYFGAQSAFVSWCEKYAGRAPPTVAWWNLLAGLNHDAAGRWNEPDAERYFAQPTPAAREAWAREEALRRLGEPLYRHAELAGRKLALLWGDEYYGAWWATRLLAPTPAGDAVARHSRWLFIASQWFHIPLLAMSLVGAIRAGWAKGGPPDSVSPDRRAAGSPPSASANAVGAAQPATKSITIRALPLSTALPILLFLGGTFVHLIFESQSRYAHVFTLGLLMLAAVGAAPRRRPAGAADNWPPADAPI